MHAFVLVALCALTGGFSAAGALVWGLPRADAQRIGWLVALATALTCAVALLARQLAKGRQRGDRSEPQVRVLDIDLHDARALRVDNNDKLAGYLFVLDAKDSLFLYEEHQWLCPESDDDRYVVPGRVHFVIATAEGHEPCLLQREDNGLLRRVPDADLALVEAVETAMSTKEGVEAVWLLPTPPSLTSSWPRSKPASSPA